MEKRLHLTWPLGEKNINPTVLLCTRLLHHSQCLPERTQGGCRGWAADVPTRQWQTQPGRPLSWVIKHRSRETVKLCPVHTRHLFSRGWKMQRGCHWQNVIILHTPLPIFYNGSWLYTENTTQDQALVSQTIRINCMLFISLNQADNLMLPKRQTGYSLFYSNKRAIVVFSGFLFTQFR